MTWTSIILIASNLASFLSLSSNDRVSSFYWIRGSKFCFLSSFSYLNCFSLILVFSRNCYLLFYLCNSWLQGNLISRPIFLYLWDSKVLRRTCAPIFLAHITRFLEARCSLEPGSRLTTGILSHTHLSPKVSHVNVCRAIANHTFSSNTISSSSHVLAWHKPLLSWRSTAWARNPQGISNSWIKVDCCLSYDSFWQFPKHSLHLIMFHWVPHTSLNAIVQAFLAMKSFAAGSSTYPCQLACVSKSVPMDVISLISSRPQLPRSAVGVTGVNRGWLLSVLFSLPSWSSGLLRVVLMMPHPSRVPLKRHLKVLFMGLLKRNK